MTETAPASSRSTPGPNGNQRGVRLSRKARRTQLLGAARDVFAAQGYHAAAMDDIADRAGISKPVLYQHFPSKLELYQALLTTYAQELVGRLREAIEATNDNQQRVHGAVAAYFDFVAGEGEAFRLVFESDLRGEPEAAAVLDNALSDCIDAVADAVTTDAGLNRDRARLLSVGLVGLSQIAARYWLDSGQAVPKQEAVALMSSLAWRGLAGFPLVHDQPAEEH
ncbi:MAG TPA: TetR/AcrR family transcriptional regulator [Pseudonocardia sp.]|jgi:AcrR family transcriptional regulator|nr:TetR/AcrR family transcriptional regulator [Pseudonocardia sp.]